MLRTAETSAPNVKEKPDSDSLEKHQAIAGSSSIGELLDADAEEIHGADPDVEVNSRPVSPLSIARELARFFEKTWLQKPDWQSGVEATQIVRSDMTAALGRLNATINNL